MHDRYQTGQSTYYTSRIIATCGIVDTLARLGCQHLYHEMHDRAVGVELLRGVAAVIGEFLDQEFIAVAELIFGDRL